MEFRLFDKPDYKAGRPGDAEWYKDRAVADHVNEPGHRTRLFQALELIVGEFDQGRANTVSDLGAGNGGLLHELKKLNISSWGYDMSPLAVEWGQNEYGVEIECRDIIEDKIRLGETVVCTEFLEHLVDPHALISWLFNQGPQSIVASVPGFEDPRNPYEFHLWAWHGPSFADMFTRAGWKVRRHFFMPSCGTQFLVAGRQ